MKKAIVIGGILASCLLLAGATILGYQDWQLRGSAPGNPASGFFRVWADTGQYFKCLTSSGAACYFDPKATSSTPGIVQTDGSTISNSSGTISCTTATTSQLGCVKPDGSTITISGGVISASGGGGGASSCAIPGYTATAIVTANWTTIGTGGTRTNTTGPCGAAISLVGSTGGTGNIFGVTTSLAAGDFTHYLVYAGNIYRANFAMTAVGFTDGTKTEDCGQIWISGGEQQLNTTRDTALIGGTYNGALGQAFSADIQPVPSNLLVKLARTGTTLSCSISFDSGTTYVPFFTDTTPFLTASSIIALVDPRGSSDAPRMTLISYQ